MKLKYWDIIKMDLEVCIMQNTINNYSHTYIIELQSECIEIYLQFV